MRQQYVPEEDTDAPELLAQSAGDSTMRERDEGEPGFLDKYWWLCAFAIGMLLFGFVKVTYGAVAAEWRVNLVKGTTTTDTPTGATEAEAWAKCQALIPKSAATSTTYRCQTPVFSAVVTPDPVTCPPAPASTTRTQTCPTGTTGTWAQTSSSTVGPAPTCTVTTIWSPTIAPSGACVTSPPTSTTPTAAVICSTSPLNQPFSACAATTLGTPSGDQAVLYCPSVVTYGSAQAACPAAYWYNWSGMQGASKTLTNAGWYPRSQIQFSTTPPPPPPPPATGSATLAWTPPTQNDDGSALTNLAGYRIVYGTSPTALTQTVQVANPSASTYVVNGLASGTWYFGVRAYDSTGAESINSNVASKVLP